MDDMAPGQLTLLIDEARSGEVESRDRLIRAIYGELQRTAGELLRKERSGHGMQPADLVHEALIRMFDSATLARALDRRYLFSAAAQAMRRVLVDHARHRSAAKREGNRARVPLDEALRHFENRGIDCLALDEALDRLKVMDERQHLIVTLRFFAGLTVADVADTLGVSTGTVEGDWRIARAWLMTQLAPGHE